MRDVSSTMKRQLLRQPPPHDGVVLVEAERAGLARQEFLFG